MNPQVIHLIMCDRAYRDPRNFLRTNVNGIQVRLRAQKPPPVAHDCHVLAMLAGFAGTGEFQVRVVDEATSQIVYQGPRLPVRFPHDPEEVHSIRFEIIRCPLPRHGRHRLELVLDNKVIAIRPFWLVPRV
jgi:hypothetical protein